MKQTIGQYELGSVIDDVANGVHDVRKYVENAERIDEKIFLLGNKQDVSREYVMENVIDLIAEYRELSKCANYYANLLEGTLDGMSRNYD